MAARISMMAFILLSDQAQCHLMYFAVGSLKGSKVPCYKIDCLKASLGIYRDSPVSLFRRSIFLVDCILVTTSHMVIAQTPLSPAIYLFSHCPPCVLFKLGIK